MRRAVVAIGTATAVLLVLHLTRTDVPADLRDCERIGDGLLRQPGNTLSAALLVVAGVIAVQRYGTVWFGWAVAGAGIGSIAVHATAHPFAGWADLAGVIAVSVTGIALVVSHRPGRWLLPGVMVLSIGLAVWGLSRDDGPWCNPDLVFGGHAAWHALAAFAALLLARGTQQRAGRAPTP